MLSKALQLTNCETYHASGDADLLIVQKAVQSAVSTNTVLVGEDTDLIVLLCYHASIESHNLFFCPEPKRNTKNPSHLEYQGYKTNAWSRHMQPYLSMHSLDVTQLLTSMELRRDLPSKSLWQVPHSESKLRYLIGILLPCRILLMQERRHW